MPVNIRGREGRFVVIRKSRNNTRVEPEEGGESFLVSTEDVVDLNEDNDAQMATTNSRITRVIPVFQWLHQNGGLDWPSRLVRLVHNLDVRVELGNLTGCHYLQEVQVPASPERLEWMTQNRSRLLPKNSRQWRDQWVQENDHSLEGRTNCDCLIECEHALVWIEGKRFDWIDAGVKWDITRDQLARNLESAWILATQSHREFCVVLCHEHPLKYHEDLLIGGYRNGTWKGGLPHLDDAIRLELGKRIGTTTWQEIAGEWPNLLDLPELRDLGSRP